MSWYVRFSTHASAKRGNNSQQSWTTTNCAITVLVFPQLSSNECGTHTRILRHALHSVNGWADNVARKCTLRCSGWCHSVDKVLMSIAATSRWVMHCNCRLTTGCTDICQYVITAAMKRQPWSSLLYHTRTANSPTEGYRSTSWQLTGSISLLSDRPLHTLGITRSRGALSLMVWYSAPW